MEKNEHKQIVDKIITAIIEDEEYCDAIMCYYFVDLTLEQKERLEPIITIAVLMGITTKKH